MVQRKEEIMQTINRVPVIDARRPATITIKPLDVRRGDKKDPGKCAAARACLHDMHAIAARVHVGRTYVELPVKLARRYGAKTRSNARRVWVRFRTPPALRTEIVSFDRANKFDPGEYILPPPQPSHRARGRAYGGKKVVKSAHPRRRPTPRHVLGGVRRFEPKELRAS